jgi:hypothetical protein
VSGPPAVGVCRPPPHPERVRNSDGRPARAVTAQCDP